MQRQPISGAQHVIGQPITRIEDRRFVTGRGKYADDEAPAACLHVAFVRAPHAHARLLHVDVQHAAEAPGVIGILTGEDYLGAGLGDLPCESMTARIAGTTWKRTPYPAMIVDESLCIGECVVMVVAQTRALAQDAADLVDLDWEVLPALASMQKALEPGAVPIHTGHDNNFCFDVEHGNADEVATAFDKAAHVVEISTVQPRVYAAAMEPRACIGSYNAADESYTLISSLQNPHSARRLIAENVLKIPVANLRVRTGDVGGSFGLKGRFYPEDVLVLWAAKVFGRPVKWRADRSEGFVADFHGRDQEASGRLALDQDGKILALDVVTRHNVGARLGPATGVSPNLTPRMLLGPYRIPCARVRAQAVFTHLRPTTSYRGAGRPEATYFIERLMDRAADQLAMDPIEIRRRNLIKAVEMPYQTAMGDRYDCGNLVACLDRALELADLNDFEERRADSASRDRLRGWGISCFIEVASISNERMEVRFDPSGDATIVAGTCSHGQGHETVFRQMACEWLGLSMDRIRFVQGDTAVVSFGGGTYASRSMTAGGSALQRACEQVLEKATAVAAWKLGCEPNNVRFEQGVFTGHPDNRSITLHDVATAAYATFGFPAEFGVGLEAVGYYQTEQQNYPNGCHIVEVEVDKGTGEIFLDRYVAVDDVGRVINPMLLEGQLHGSIVQGVGAALQERLVHDEEGQLLTAAFTEYAMPKARHMPNSVFGDHCNIPTASNPLGVKGGAEVGTIAAPPAIIRAVNEALGLSGNSVLEMPLLQADILDACIANGKVRK